MENPEFHETVVLGAGPAGLAVGGCLRRAGRPFVMLDKSDAVGASWRTHYERLHLHTVKRHSNLPYLRFRRGVPAYPSRQQVVDYLERYREHWKLEPRLGVTCERAAFRDGGWDLQTDQGALRATNLVIATGYNHEPHVPSWPDQERFGGEIRHSFGYKNGEAYRDKDVLVVGLGNTGGEIALCLFEHGARPSIAVRSPIHVIPRETMGISAQVFGIALRKMPLGMADAIGTFVNKLSVGDLSHLGLRRPSIGAASQVARKGRVPLIDIGTVERIRKGEIQVVPAFERFTETGVVFPDGTERRFDAVILATGFKARLDDFLDGADELVDDRGYPTVHGAECTIGGRRGLYFLGFANPISGALREIGIEAKRIADAIAAAPAEPLTQGA